MFGTGPPWSLFSVAHVLVEKCHDGLERRALHLVGLVALPRPARAPLVGVLGVAEARPVGVTSRAREQLLKLSEQTLEVVLVAPDHEDRKRRRYALDAPRRLLHLDLVVVDVGVELELRLGALAGVAQAEVLDHRRL